MGEVKNPAEDNLCTGKMGLGADVDAQGARGLPFTLVSGVDALLPHNMDTRLQQQVWRCVGGIIPQKRASLSLRVLNHEANCSLFLFPSPVQMLKL